MVEKIVVEKIVVLSDGTGNSSSKSQKTNVWRIFQALVPSSAQVAKYDDGVGTSTNKYLALLGGVFGWGLKRNVISLYCFICRHYPDVVDAGGHRITGVRRPDIYGFGFSRGSFTIRTLVGLIQREGLVIWRNEDELRRNARMAYRSYRAKSFPAHNVNRPGRYLVCAARWLRDATLRWRPEYEKVATETKAAGRNPGVDRDGRRIDGVTVKFLGLFDTVEAYGLPIAELKTGIDRYLWPMSFCNLDLPKIVDHARHALALDEERATFQPYQWDEECESQMIKDGLVPAGRLKQVWFAGVHSNVGGGYPEDQLSCVPLEWIMHEALAQGLTLEAGAVAEIERSKSALARQYDSRAGFGAYWRYDPRGTNMYSPQGDHHADRRKTDLSGVYSKPSENPLIKLDVNGVRIRPVVHHSVLARMTFDDGYASAALPGTFWVLDPDGVIKPVGENPGASGREFGAVELDLTKPDAQFGALPVGKPAALVKNERDMLAQALTRLTAPKYPAVSLVWDTIWWRRVLALGVATLTGVLVLAIIVSDWSTDLAASDVIFSGPISVALDLVRAFIPSYATRAANALVRHPLEIFGLMTAIIMCVRGGDLLQTRIVDRVRVGWNPSLRKSYLAATCDADAGLRNKFGYWAIGFALLTLALWAYAKVTGGVSPTAVRQSLIVTLVFAVLYGWRWFAHRAFVKAVEHPPADDPAALPETALLKFAHACRTSPAVVKIYDRFGNTAVPGAFALLVVGLALVAVNQIAFIGANSAGLYCESAAKSSTQVLNVNGVFDTSRSCWASGAWLIEGRHYEITMTSPGDWFDRSMRADLGGVWDASLPHVAAWPLKRWLFKPYFQPVARVGRFGNDEFALQPVRAYERIETPKQCRAIETPGSRLERISDAQARDLITCAPTPPERNELTARIKPRSSGEVFFYVNDAAWFFRSGFFYANNRGTATITIKHIDDEPNYRVVTSPTSIP